MSLTDLAERTQLAYPTAHREVGRLLDAGVLAERRLGRTRLIRANPDSPLVPPLREILLIATGPVVLLADALVAIPKIECAFLYGSFAARTRRTWTAASRHRRDGDRHPRSGRRGRRLRTGRVAGRAAGQRYDPYFSGVVGGRWLLAERPCPSTGGDPREPAVIFAPLTPAQHNAVGELVGTRRLEAVPPDLQRADAFTVSPARCRGRCADIRRSRSCPDRAPASPSDTRG